MLISVEGGAGCIRLNRPKGIHALNSGMRDAVNEALAYLRTDPAVALVRIDEIFAPLPANEQWSPA